ncbi:MAG TPA: hypothetical protein DHV80_01130 [Acidimicrobiaceae bacterium]|nr:hypothetical protein [Acidimicrobiaceae bacterium]
MWTDSNVVAHVILRFLNQEEAAFAQNFVFLFPRYAVAFRRSDDALVLVFFFLFVVFVFIVRR